MGEIKYFTTFTRKLGEDLFCVECDSAEVDYIVSVPSEMLSKAMIIADMAFEHWVQGDEDTDGYIGTVDDALKKEGIIATFYDKYESEDDE